jgi:FlaA1/EpsC-like NDP-sugar epimerase
MGKVGADADTESMSEIQSFFKDSSVFITGATGFLGHVLLAKLLK